VKAGRLLLISIRTKEPDRARRHGLVRCRCAPAGAGAM
jgi:hypothetical protein